MFYSFSAHFRPEFDLNKMYTNKSLIQKLSTGTYFKSMKSIRQFPYTFFINFLNSHYDFLA